MEECAETLTSLRQSALILAVCVEMKEKDAGRRRTKYERTAVTSVVAYKVPAAQPEWERKFELATNHGLRFSRCNAGFLTTKCVFLNKLTAWWTKILKFS